MTIYGYWTGHGDYCAACAIKRFGWPNRRVVRDYVKNRRHGGLPFALWPRLPHYDPDTGKRTSVKNPHRWHNAVLGALNAGECLDLAGGEIDPWHDCSDSPRHRLFCEDCGVDLGVEPLCIKDNPGAYDMEACDCSACNPPVSPAGAGKTLIHTFDYQGQSCVSLIERVHALDAILVDIRLSPRSRIRWWNKLELMGALLHRYRWLPDLGNRNYKGGPIAIWNLERGLASVEELIAEGRPVVLMCVCSRYDTCHRRLVAEALREKGHTVEELSL